VKTVTAEPIDRCVTAVGTLFGSVFQRIELWRDAVAEYAEAHSGTATRAGIDALIEAAVVQELTGDARSIIGAGYVAEPGFITDARWHLAWWLGDLNTFGMGSDAPRIRRLDAVEDPDSESFRDYTSLEWWRVPARTQQRHITGPYVDYLCTDEYTLTLTTPVFHRNVMVGVTGADLYVADVERSLLPAMRAVNAGVTLVNDAGRVVLSTDLHLATGALLRADGLLDSLRRLDGPTVESARLPDGRRIVGCPDSGLALLVDE
jgi:hypothetical protein